MQTHQGDKIINYRAYFERLARSKDIFTIKKNSKDCIITSNCMFCAISFGAIVMASVGGLMMMMYQTNVSNGIDVSSDFKKYVTALGIMFGVYLLTIGLCYKSYRVANAHKIRRELIKKFIEDIRYYGSMQVV